MSKRSDDLLDQVSGTLISATARAVVSLFRPLLQPLGLTHPQYLALLALDRTYPRSCTQLSDTLHLTTGTMTPLLQRLDTLGLIRRDRNPHDDRELDISLTAEGQNLLPVLWDIGEQVRQTVGATTSDPHQLARLLHRIVLAGT